MPQVARGKECILGYGINIPLLGGLVWSRGGIGPPTFRVAGPALSLFTELQP